MTKSLRKWFYSIIFQGWSQNWQLQEHLVVGVCWSGLRSNKMIYLIVEGLRIMFWSSLLTWWSVGLKFNSMFIWHQVFTINARSAQDLPSYNRQIAILRASSLQSYFSIIEERILFMRQFPGFSEEHFIAWETPCILLKPQETMTTWVLNKHGDAFMPSSLTPQNQIWEWQHGYLISMEMHLCPDLWHLKIKLKTHFKIKIEKK